MKQRIDNNGRVHNFTLYIDLHATYLDNFYMQEVIILKYQRQCNLTYVREECYHY